MNEFIQNALDSKMLYGAVDVVDIVPIPKHGDRMVRLQTIGEALDEFDRAPSASETVSYLIQVRPTKNKSANTPVADLPEQAVPGPSPTPMAQKNAVDGTYLPTGKLNTPYLIRNAELLAASGEFGLAKNIFKAILQSGENTALALSGLAKCLEAEGKFKEAQSHYEESIAYHNTLETYQNLANLFFKTNQDRQAAEALGRALHLKDLNTHHRFELHRSLGNTFNRTGDAEKAVLNYRKALEIAPTADDVRAAIGNIYLKSGKTEEARRHFQEAAAANPRNSQALFGLGSCALQAGDKRGAHDYLARSLELDLNHPTAVFHLVKCAYEIKSYATAARVLEEYMEIAPINTNLLYSLAGLQFHLSRFDDARATIHKIQQMSPNHPGAKELSGLIEKYIGPPL